MIKFCFLANRLRSLAVHRFVSKVFNLRAFFIRIAHVAGTHIYDAACAQ